MVSHQLYCRPVLPESILAVYRKQRNHRRNHWGGDAGNQGGLYQLLCGETIAAYIDTSVIYPEIQNNPYCVYSFLLVAGYLKVAAVYPQNDGNFMCDIAIPNKEISFVYEKEILNRTNQNNTAIFISQAIFSGDAQKLQSVLESTQATDR